LDLSIRGIAHSIFISVLLIAGNLAAQQSPAPSCADENYISYPAPVAGQRLVRFNGFAFDAANKPLTGVAGVTFAIYTEQNGGAPLWQETQNLTTDGNGRFSAMLGAISATGIPAELFGSGDARWLAVLTHSPGVSEQPRVLLVSVPYAIQAANADTLNGLPAAAFMRAGAVVSYPAALSPPPTHLLTIPALTGTGGTANYLAIFSQTAGNLNNSLLYQSGSNLGLGTTSPAFNMHVISQSDPAAIAVEGYDTTGANFIGRRAEGTLAMPTALLANDNIVTMQGRGYGATAFSPSRAYMKFFAAENWTDAAQGTYISLATTTKGTAPNGPPTERIRIDDRGYVGIGTTSPDQALTVNGSIHSTTGGFIFPDGSVLSSAATLPGQQGGNLILPAGNGIGGAGNLQLQTIIASTNMMSDRLLIAGMPKTMSGAVPTANLFSMHIPSGEAAGGKVKFTIVASDGTNYAMETGEMIYLANPKQFICKVVYSEYATVPPSFTNTVLAVPAIGQIGSLNAQCGYAPFFGDPGVQIFDTAPTTFTATTHKVYYTIENQSQAAITLQP
jgi:hypothetical protein